MTTSYAAGALDLMTVCRELGISRSQGYALLREGNFPIEALRVGSLYRFRASDLRDYLRIDDRQPAA